MSRFVLTAQLQLQAPRNVGSVVRQMQSQLSDIKVKVSLDGASRTSSDLNKINKDVKKVTDSASRMGKAFAVSVKRFAAFSIATRTVSLFTNVIGGAVEEAINFERQLVKVSQVTGKSLSQLKDLTREITRLSTSLGVSSRSLIEVSRTLSQAGLDAQQTKVALEALAKTSLAPTFEDITETAEGAVAIFNQFGQGAEALEKQLGAINAVAGRFAVEAGDLISTIRRTGGVFKAAGGNLNELIALFTSVRATTREAAESIATGLRTIFTRIQRPSTIKFLRELGVELLNAEGKFVGPFEAVKRLSEALSDIQPGDIRFVQIAEQLGGFRQIGKVIPMIQQFAVAQEALKVAMDGQDSLAQDAIDAQQALAVRITKVKEEFLALVRAVSESATFQLMANTALSLASALIKIADALKPLLPMLTLMAGIKIFSGLKSFAGGIMGRGAATPQKFATGGVVPGSGNRDTVPAMLTPGEFVIRKSSVKKIGAGNLQRMNDGGVVLDAKLADESMGIFALTRNRKDTEGDLSVTETPWGSYPITNKKGGITALNSNFSLGLSNTGDKLSAFKNLNGDQQQQLLRDAGEDGAAFLESLELPHKPNTRVTGSKVTGKPLKNALAAGTVSETQLSNILQGIQVPGSDIPATATLRISGTQKQMLIGQAPNDPSDSSGLVEAVRQQVYAKSSEKLKEAVTELVDSNSGPIAKLKAGIEPTVAFNQGAFDGHISKLVKNEQGAYSQAVKGIAGFVQEGLIAGVTGATLGGGGTSFDFPNVSAQQSQLSSLYGGDFSNMESGDAKPTAALDEFRANAKKLADSITSNADNRFTTANVLLDDVVRMATGGAVSDTVPALLTPGEFVVNRSSARRIGYGNLHRMNTKGVQGFASGGIVGGPRTFANGGSVARENAVLRSEQLQKFMMSMGAAATASTLVAEAFAKHGAATEEDAALIREFGSRITAGISMFSALSIAMDGWKNKLDDAGDAAIESGQEWAKAAQKAGKSITEIGSMAKRGGATDRERDARAQLAHLGGKKADEQIAKRGQKKFDKLGRQDEKLGKQEDKKKAQVQEREEQIERLQIAIHEKRTKSNENTGRIDKIADRRRELKPQLQEREATATQLDKEIRGRQNEIKGRTQAKEKADQTVAETFQRGQEIATELEDRDKKTKGLEKSRVKKEKEVDRNRQGAARAVEATQTAREEFQLDREQSKHIKMSAPPMANVGGQFRSRTPEEQSELDDAKGRLERLQQGLPADGGAVGGGGTVAQMQVQAQQVIIQAQSVTMTEGDVNVPVVKDEKAIAAAEAEVASLSGPRRHEAGAVSTTKTRDLNKGEIEALGVQHEKVKTLKQNIASGGPLLPSTPEEEAAVSGKVADEQAAVDALAKSRQQLNSIIEQQAQTQEEIRQLSLEGLEVSEANKDALAESLKQGIAIKDARSELAAALDAEKINNEQIRDIQDEINAGISEEEALINKNTKLYKQIEKHKNNEAFAANEVKEINKEILEIEKQRKAVQDQMEGGPEGQAIQHRATMVANAASQAAGGGEAGDEAAGKVAAGMERIVQASDGLTDQFGSQEKFLKAYSTELSRGVPASKAYNRAMKQAGVSASGSAKKTSKLGSMMATAGSKIRGGANKVASGFAKVNSKLAGMGKSVGAVMAMGQQAVAFVQDLQQKQFDKALEQGDTATAEGMIGDMGKMDAVGGAMSGAMAGAAMGAMFGPLGAAIGGLVGLLGGLAMALLGFEAKFKEREKKVAAVEMKKAKEATGKAMTDISEKGLSSSSVKDATAAIDAQGAAMNKKSKLDGKMLHSDEERKKMGEEIAAQELQLASAIGSRATSEKELEDAMEGLLNNTTGNAKAEMDAARSAFAVAQANRALAKANADLLKITSAFNAATNAVSNFVKGLETGTNRFDSIVTDLEESQKNIALGKGGVQAVDKARSATMEGLKRAGLDETSELGKSVARSFDQQEKAAEFMANMPRKLDSMNFTQGDDAATVRDKLRSELITADMSGPMKDIVEGQLAKLTDKQLQAVASGEMDISELLQGMGKDISKLGAGALAAAKAMQAHEQAMIGLTQKRIAAEKNLISAQMQAVDVFMEAADILAQVGGEAVTPEMRTQATLEKANIAGRGLGLSDLKTGSAEELRQRTNEIMQEFGKQEIKGRTPGEFSGAEGLDADKRAELQKAMQDQIALHRDLIKNKMEELKILEKKNALEKESLEAALKGDMETFLKKQAAAGATAAAATGDQRLMRMFGADAVGEAFSNVQRMQQEGVQDVEGMNIDQVKATLAATGLAMRGLGDDPRMTDLLAGQMPEQERLKGEIGELAMGMSDTAQAATELAEMQVQTANMNIAQANLTFQKTLEHGDAQFRRWGGPIYANRGMFIPRGTDTVPAMLTPGEFVVRKESVNRGNNLQMLKAINQGSYTAGFSGAVQGVQRLARGGRVQYLQEGGVAAAAGAGVGIDPALVSQLAASLDRFNSELSSNIASLQNMKFQIKLDTTNLNVNLNGTSFLAQLKDSLKQELLAEVGNRIKDLKFNNAGEPQTSSSVLG